MQVQFLFRIGHWFEVNPIWVSIITTACEWISMVHALDHSNKRECHHFDDFFHWLNRKFRHWLFMAQQWRRFRQEVAHSHFHFSVIPNLIMTIQLIMLWMLRPDVFLSHPYPQNDIFQIIHQNDLNSKSTRHGKVLEYMELERDRWKKL